MTFEVDVRKVGEESKSGDAIALRYGDFSFRNGHKVVVIDGGFQKNGEDLVDLIKNTYGTDRVDLVVSTHPDADHSSGLKVVLEELAVGTLWMHQPWKHERAVAEYVTLGKSSKKFDEQLEKSIGTARDLEEIAVRKRIPIVEPFAGVASPDGALTVLGPSSEYYRELLAAYEDAGAAQARSLREAVAALFKEAMAKMREWWGVEALEEPEPNATRPQNNTSAIVLAKLDEKYFLFTGDAGAPALDRAVPSSLGPALNGALSYFQLPHHGSKRNVGPTILDRILGPRVAQGTTTGKTAFVSAAADGNPKHPAQRVVNAAVRRGAKVISTQGSDLRMKSHDAPERPGWGPATPLAFVTEYED